MTRDKIPALVDRVVSDHERYKRARAEQLQAQADILDKVLEEVRPAIPALVSRDPLGFPAVRVLGVGGLELYLREGADWLEIHRDNRGAPAAGVNDMGGSLGVLKAGWTLDAIVESLAELLEQQVRGRKFQAIERAESTAARLRAVLRLL